MTTATVRTAKGTIYKIISGTHTGKYGVAYKIAQGQAFLSKNKLVVRVFEDVELTRPVLKDGKAVVSLFNTARLEVVGFTY